MASVTWSTMASAPLPLPATSILSPGLASSRAQISIMGAMAQPAMPTFRNSCERVLHLAGFEPRLLSRFAVSPRVPRGVEGHLGDVLRA